ncbi:TIR domain-containing protein [Saccharopolyspora taberi]|uniref:Thoeris protein ThsB TIR-like domain-containing protein n=1 Tax=Saccharopolyspora taberi TaxID=60895 RepID=A0ABN3VER5_9PSEU
MTRRVFYSFHYKPDNWRAATVRQIGAIEGQRVLNDNEWEKVAGRGDQAISQWIDGQMYHKGCVVVLIGSATAGRKWINYEIKKGWKDQKGVVGIHINKLLDRNQEQSRKGLNPFGGFNIGDKNMSQIVKCYDPPYLKSVDAYRYISDNIAAWVEEAIRIRQRH